MPNKPKLDLKRTTTASHKQLLSELPLCLEEGGRWWMFSQALLRLVDGRNWSQKVRQQAERVVIILFAALRCARNLNTLLGAPKESAKANYGPSAGLKRGGRHFLRCDRVGW